MNSTYCGDCGTFLTDVNIWPFCRGDATKHARVEHFGAGPAPGPTPPGPQPAQKG